MIQVQFLNHEHIQAERYLNGLQWSERDYTNDTLTIVSYIGMTHNGDEVRVLIEDE
jgi:hypothetical protein